MEQCGRNFILHRHTSAYMDTSQFSAEALACLRRSGFVPEFQTTFTIHHVRYIEDDAMGVRSAVDDAVVSFIANNLQLPDDVPKKRVGRLVRYHVTLASTSGIANNLARKDAQTNDTYLRVDEKEFGQVAEMYELPTEEKFVVVLQKFRKVIVISSQTGCDIPMPRNHYPFATTNEYFVFEINRSVFLQKGSFCLLQYTNDVKTYPCLSFRPNDWFSF